MVSAGLSKLQQLTPPNRPEGNMATTQHRPKREDANAKERADLKRENGQLKRKICRLQKELERQNIRTEEIGELAQEESSTEVSATSGAVPCEKCGYAALREIVLIGKTFLVCPACKFRKKISDGT